MVLSDVRATADLSGSIRLSEGRRRASWAAGGCAGNRVLIWLKFRREELRDLRSLHRVDRGVSDLRNGLDVPQA
eukprot:26227-Prymnesium_polylepis.1